MLFVVSEYTAHSSCCLFLTLWLVLLGQHIKHGQLEVAGEDPLAQTGWLVHRQEAGTGERIKLTWPFLVNIDFSMELVKLNKQRDLKN